ncbi:hypothetical protein BRC97_01150 [Halobacteriales archaeon QS_6_71_20]|nr:MAG: hypothetical protein BRC97_01150 [Halobacteriales archaeon QS_6_71_20]
MNPAFEDVFGWTADDVVGGAAATLLARAVPYGFPDCDDPGARAAATVEGVAAGVEQTTGAERADAAHDPDSDSLAACAVVAVVVGELVAGGSVDDALSAARSVAFDRGAPVGVRETLAVVGDPAAATLDTGGGVGATLETALHEAVAAAAPEEAVVSAASRGGAASALGAVAGGVAGARAGVDGVPPRWLNELDAVDRLADLAAGLADARIEP